MFPGLRCLGVCALILVNATIRADEPVTAIAFAPGGEQVLIGSQRGIEIQSWPGLAGVESLRTELINVHDLQFSPDGKQLLAAGGSPAESGEVEVWSWPERQLLRKLADHSDLVYRVSWSPDGTRWASCGGDALCFVYSTEKGEERVRYDGHSRPVLSIRWLDQHTLVSVGLDQTVRHWDSELGTHLRTLDNHLNGVNDIAIHPLVENQGSDPKKHVIATVGEDQTVRLWQPRIGRLMRFVRLDSVPRCVIWSADATGLLVGCNDGRVRIIDWEKMESTTEIEGGVGRVFELALDPKTNLLLVAGEMGCRKHLLNSKPNSVSGR